MQVWYLETIKTNLLCPSCLHPLFSHRGLRLTASYFREWSSRLRNTEETNKALQANSQPTGITKNSPSIICISSMNSNDKSLHHVTEIPCRASKASLLLARVERIDLGITSQARTLGPGRHGRACNPSFWIVHLPTVSLPKFLLPAPQSPPFLHSFARRSGSLFSRLPASRLGLVGPNEYDDLISRACQVNQHLGERPATSAPQSMDWTELSLRCLCLCTRAGSEAEQATPYPSRVVGPVQNLNLCGGMSDGDVPAR